jgi:hypothetical protein
MQATAQADQMRMQADGQIAQAKAQAEMQLAQMKLQAEAAMEDQKSQHLHAMKQSELDHAERLERWKVELEQATKITVARISANTDADSPFFLAQEAASQKVAEELSNNMNRMNDMHSNMADMVGQTMKRIDGAVGVMASPKRIIRGQDGKAIGVEMLQNANTDVYDPLFMTQEAATKKATSELSNNLNIAMGKMNEIQSNMASMIGQTMNKIDKAVGVMAAPKRIVRDKDGRAVGVEVLK